MKTRGTRVKFLAIGHERGFLRLEERFRRRTVRLCLGPGWLLTPFVEVLLPFFVRGVAQLPVSLLAAEL